MSNVNHPKHYNRGKIEVIEFLEEQFAGRPHEWNACKYLCRADLKGHEIEDLEKAIWYIKRKIELLKALSEARSPTRPNAMNPKQSIAAPPSPLELRRSMCTVCGKEYGEHFGMFCDVDQFESRTFVPHEKPAIRAIYTGSWKEVVPEGADKGLMQRAFVPDIYVQSKLIGRRGTIEFASSL